MKNDFGKENLYNESISPLLCIIFYSFLNHSSMQDQKYTKIWKRSVATWLVLSVTHTHIQNSIQFVHCLLPQNQIFIFKINTFIFFVLSVHYVHFIIRYQKYNANFVFCTYIIIFTRKLKNWCEIKKKFSFFAVFWLKNSQTKFNFMENRFWFYSVFFCLQLWLWLWL